MTVLAPFLCHVTRAPDAIALIAADDESCSYAALDGWSAALARRYARAGVEAGTRVLVALPMSTALYAALMALWRLGAVAVFPEPSMGVTGLRTALADAAPTRFVGKRRIGWAAAALSGRVSLATSLPIDFETARGDAPSWPDEHPALISFTSGSTGRPKGLLRTHGLLLAQQRALEPLLAPDEPSRDLVCLPLFVLACLGLGVAAAIPDADLRRPAEADAARLGRQIQRMSLTRLLAPPSIAAALAGQPAFARLQGVFTGGGPVWPDVARRMIAAAPEAAITAVYGSTEAEPIAAQRLDQLDAGDWTTMADGGGLAAGVPTPGVRVRIVDDEIQVAGAHVQRGYLDRRRDTETKVWEGGTVWHCTGDAGRIGADKRLWLLGRLAGKARALFPFAVEVAARGWPGVTQAALLAGEGDADRLILAGSAGCLADWRDRARVFPDVEVIFVAAIPLDRRHQSKVDYARLRRQVVGAPK